MRIVTWNCARGPLATKVAAVQRLEPDLVVLTEAPRPKESDPDMLWFGDGRYGVAILARAPFVAREVPTSRAVHCVYPVDITGPSAFRLFGVWTWPAPTYKRALLDGLDAHRALQGPRVVAGDFNGNVDFDKPRSRARWSHCVDRLEQDGLVSAYHGTRPLGAEADPTHFFQWREARPFHIDYCFVPQSWHVESVTVGAYADWANLSDQRPISVDVHAD